MRGSRALRRALRSLRHPLVRGSRLRAGAVPALPPRTRSQRHRGLVARVEFAAAEMWIKLGLAIACGAAIGIERELHDKPAGLRTNMLICVGSTLITMVSISVALTYAQRQINIADPGRIAAQIVSGIGFLGAGTIIQARGSVHGLTTAATMWVVSAIGIAVGAGQYGEAIGTTVLVLVALLLLGKIEARLIHAKRAQSLVVQTIPDIEAVIAVEAV